MQARRWSVALVVAVLIIGLIAFARGREHHRGDERGALGSASRLSAPV
jgi:hypothetical protein